jgi:hypothetical protein
MIGRSQKDHAGNTVCGNAVGTEERARQVSVAYERAVTSASREDLLISSHAALSSQHAQEMDSVA